MRQKDYRKGQSTGYVDCNIKIDKKPLDYIFDEDNQLTDHQKEILKNRTRKPFKIRDHINRILT